MLHRKGDRTRQLSVGVFGVSLHLWRGIVPSPLYAPLNATRFVASFRAYSRCQDANYSGGVPFLESESPALLSDSHRRLRNEPLYARGI